SCIRTHSSLVISPNNGDGTTGPAWAFNRSTLFFRSATAYFGSPPGRVTVSDIVGFPAGKLLVAMYPSSFLRPTVFRIIQKTGRMTRGIFGNPSTGNR